MPGEAINVFVSYSHADASLVAPVVKLLRVNKSLVFQFSLHPVCSRGAERD
jgi:hypothetical protein